MLFSKSASQRQIDLALLSVRLMAGLGMAAHGYQKVFVYGFEGITAGFAGMGMPMPSLLAPAVSILELVGGVLIAAGLLTRPIALMLAADMFVASFFVHMKDGFFAPKGAELTLFFLSNYIALTLAGAGNLSADAAVSNKK